MMETGEIKYEKVYASPRPPPNNWMKELGSEVDGGSETPNKPNQGQKTQLLSTETLVKSEQPSGSSAQEIEKVSCLAAKAPT